MVPGPQTNLVQFRIVSELCGDLALSLNIHVCLSHRYLISPYKNETSNRKLIRRLVFYL